ncbi:MAG: hypothetical protein IPH59_02210 [bacterium]|nr:hypothetical protein [bacterium]
MAGVLTGAGQSTAQRMLFCVPYAPEQTASGSVLSQTTSHLASQGTEQQDDSSAISWPQIEVQMSSAPKPKQTAGHSTANKNENKL